MQLKMRFTFIRLWLKQVLLVTSSMFFAAFIQPAIAQSASIDFTAERNYVFQDGNDGLLPFVVVINNPTSSSLVNVQFAITMPDSVELGNVDQECIESTDGSIRTISCTIAEMKSQSSKLVDFFVDGGNSTEAGPSFALVLDSPSIPVTEPSAFEASLADGDTRINGAILTIHLVRNISFDVDQNKVPDLDESIMNLAPGTPVELLIARAAVVDILFIYSPAAAQYLEGKLESRLAQLITAANQVFRENDVAIKFNGVGLAEVPYTITDGTLSSTFDALQANTDPAFDNIDQMITNSGGDLIVFLHALESGTDTVCGFSSLNAIGRQGDFQQAYHQGELISVVDIGPDCLGLPDLAPGFAANMGIVPTREEYPDGGTFSYSSGYGVTDMFTTVSVRLGSLAFGSAEDLNRFSNAGGFCKSLICGIDRNNIAQGADAVHSLNKTRHVVSAITDSVFPVSPDSIKDKFTILSSNSYDLYITQTALASSALENEFIEMQVSITNPSIVTLHNLDISLAHLNDGLLDPEVQTYEISDDLCRILGSDLNVTSVIVGEAQQKPGRLTCFVESIAPGQNINFSYRIQIDTTPPILNGNSYYHEIVTVNNIPQLESTACIPVFSNFVEADTGSNVCSDVQALIPEAGQEDLADLDALPTVTGSMISLPFIRLFDGSLISAEFEVTFVGQSELQLLSYTELDSTLTPAFEATFDASGVLRISSLQVDTNFYDVQATYVPNSDPIRFSPLTIVLLGP